MICRCCRSPAPSRPEALPLFLDGDDCLRLIQAAAQGGILAIGLGQFGLQRIDRSFLGTARTRLQRAQSAGFALPPPVAQRRGIQALPTKNGGDATRIYRAVSLRQNPQLRILR